MAKRIRYTYTTNGEKSGECGHKHRTFREAWECLDSYQKEELRRTSDSDARYAEAMCGDRCIYRVAPGGTRTRMEV